MAWYAYCVTEKRTFPELLRHRKPIPLPLVSGIDQNQVFLYPASDFAVLVSEYLPGDTASPSAAKSHAKVVSECFQQGAVLPFRFGTVFANDEALRRTIRSNSRSFAANLSYLQGKVEMHIKVTLDDCCREQLRSALPVENGSNAYLSNLRQSATRQRERQTLARTISMQMNRMFVPIAEEISCRTDNGKLVLELSHLIDRRLVERYQNKFTSVRNMMQSCQMQLSGPWPAYHFIHKLPGRPAVPPVPAIAAAAVVPAISA